MGSKKGPIVDPGKCRCCGMMKRCRLLNFEYESLGNREVYSEMFVDCFGLVLSHLDVEEAERLICATCVVRLRDARTFRNQVLQCEEKLLTANVFIHEDVDDAKVKLEIKQETSEAVPVEYVTEDSMVNDECDSNDDHIGDVEMDSVYGTSDTVSTDGKLLLDTDKPSRRLRPRVVNNSSKAKPESSLQIDMLKKLNKMKQKLNKKARKEYIPTTFQSESYSFKQKNTPAPDKEFNTIRNAIVIIENSYVTPFTNTFSDYHCFYCKEMFIEPEKLRQHTLEHDPRTYQEHMNPKKMSLVDITRIDCRLCQTQIDNIDSFKQHITTVHTKMLHKDADTEFIRVKLKKGKLLCLECEKPFNFFQALKKHMAQHFGTYICEECGSHYFEERHLVFHKRTHLRNGNVVMFPCTECEKSFRSKNSRSFHVAKIHRNEPAYPCNKCDDVFVSYHMRYRHKINVHGEKREFACEDCDKVYDCRKTLREHNHRTHLQLLRHECTLCDKRFYLPSALKDHMTSHTGERLFRCDYCGKTYPRKKALKVHLQSHNTEKKYKCSLCPSSYTQANNFKNHMKSKHPVPVEYGDVYN